MRKATTKQEVLELYTKFIIADLELYNATCQAGLEMRLEDVVNHLCFENKINILKNRFTVAGTSVEERAINWFQTLPKEDNL